MKKKILLRTMVAIAIIVFASISIKAQVPQGINYQAVLRNASGQIMQNQNVMMKFTIHKSFPSGTIAYEETQSMTTNGYGLVNLQIGQGASTGNGGSFTSIQWGTNNYFLQVQADPGTGYVNLGTTQFISVPYAMVADTVLHGGGGGDNWGSQTAATNATLSGNGTSGNPLGIAQQGATNGQVLSYNGTNWIPSTPSSNSGWSLTGNSGTIDGTNFIGTTDSIAVNFKVNNQQAGRIDPAGSTFYGYKAGMNNLSTNGNTGIGFNALYSHTTGHGNTANGAYALYSNTTGFENISDGNSALFSNTTGYLNTATGVKALFSNTTGVENTALGWKSLYSNTDAYGNVAIGVQALYLNTNGLNNTALGSNAFSSGTSYMNSTALGYYANITANNQVSLGNSSVTSLYCYGAKATGLTSTGALCVTSSGQIGIASSSKRYKKDIVPLEINTSLLYKLRPVSFTYINDSSRSFGLIAEEVNKIIPQLVFYRKAKDVIPGSTSDELIPEGVHYENLPTLLLAEIQKQHTNIEGQQAMILELQKQVAALQAQLIMLQGNK